MTAKNFAFYGGILLLVLGAVAFMPGMEGSLQGLPTLELEMSYGLFLGLFPMNIVSKGVFIVLGLAGILVSRKDDLRAWINYSKVTFFILGVLAILGIPYATNTLGGYYPLFGNAVLLNGLFALAAGYCAFFWYKKDTPTTTHTQRHA